METNGLGIQARIAAYTGMKSIPAREALTRNPRNIEVAENSELSLSPAHPELAECFAKVRLRNYEDLQLLGFVPRKLAEDRIRGALKADDDEVYRIASASTSAPSHCDCNGEATGTRSFASGLRASYNAVRKKHNPTLARVLSDHYGASIAWDDPIAGAARNWVSKLDSKAAVVIVALFQDIKIHRNATLSVDAGTDSLLAHDIMIHRSGRLVQRGSYMKIWANSVTTFLDLASQLDTKVTSVQSPWLAGVA